MSNETEPTRGTDEQQPREEQEPTLQDILRRAIGSGVRTVRGGEERIRDIATKVLSSEQLKAVTGTISQLREDLVSVAGRELRRYFEGLNLTEEIVKVLTAISLEVKTEIRFIPNEKKLVTPKVESDVTVRRTRRKPAKEQAAEAGEDAPEDCS